MPGQATNHKKYYKQLFIPYPFTPLFYIGSVKRLWHIITMLLLVTICTSTKANNAPVVVRHANHVEISELHTSSEEGTLPTVLQVINHLPAVYRSSNYIDTNIPVHHTGKAYSGTVFCTYSHISSFHVSAVAIHIATSVLLI